MLCDGGVLPRRSFLFHLKECLDVTRAIECLESPRLHVEVCVGDPFGSLSFDTRRRLAPDKVIAADDLVGTRPHDENVRCFCAAVVVETNEELRCCVGNVRTHERVAGARVEAVEL